MKPRCMRGEIGKVISDISDYLNQNSKKYREMVERIRNDLGANSLNYQRLQDMIKAIGLLRKVFTYIVGPAKINLHFKSNF